MNNGLDDIEFNEFLKKETGQHKMYPSDQLWRNIQQELHGKKKWPALTVIAFLVVTALTISTVIYDHPASTYFKSLPLTATNLLVATNPTVADTRKNNSANTSLYRQTAVNTNPVSFNNTPLLLDNTSSTDGIAENQLLIAENESTASPINSDQSTTTEENGLVIIPIAAFTKQSIVSVSGVGVNSPTAKNLQVTAINKNLGLKKNLFDEGSKPDDFINDLGFEKMAPILIKKKASKFQLQVHIAPSISYRKLIDDKTRNNYEPISAPYGLSGPVSPRYSIDVNDVVRHKPAMGAEIGVGVLYRLNKKLKLSLGFQFNSRKYFIDSYKGGLNVATIAVIRNNRLDTISQVTSISANDGYAETQLDSKLYQVSVPIGLQWQAIQLKHFGINIEGTIQPTLTLNKNVYLISTDYKYYTDGTSFFRKWNLNTSAQINFTYKTGNYNWFIGPQLRYQHLPTYTEKYPIKEHRLDYGIRVGFIKQLFK